MIIDVSAIILGLCALVARVQITTLERARTLAVPDTPPSTITRVVARVVARSRPSTVPVPPVVPSSSIVPSSSSVVPSSSSVVLSPTSIMTTCTIRCPWSILRTSLPPPVVRGTGARLVVVVVVTSTVPSASTTYIGAAPEQKVVIPWLFDCLLMSDLVFLPELQQSLALFLSYLQVEVSQLPNMMSPIQPNVFSSFPMAARDSDTSERNKILLI